MAATAAAKDAETSTRRPSVRAEERFQIALVIQDFNVKDEAISAIASPVSNCKVAAMVILSSSSCADHNVATTDNDRAIEWLQGIQVPRPELVDVLYGDSGLQEILKRPTVDAVYVIVPTEDSRKIGVDCLQAGKHVLLKDPLSTSFDSFRDQLACARQVDKFIQFSTTFVHHHRVKTFMDCVLRETFGTIESIDAMLTVSSKDVEQVGVHLPLQEGDGCIRRLGRYCVLISALLMARVGSFPLSARVVKFVRSPEGEPLQADCVVTFSDNRVSTFHVAYSSAPTRQVIEVRAKKNYATMTDFVIPHPDGLATYRTYQKATCPLTGKLEVEHGEAVDVPSGLPQDIMMWRRFRELSLSVDKEGWDAKEGQVRELTNVALQTKRVLTTLMESLERGHVEIPIDIEDCRL